MAHDDTKRQVGRRQQQTVEFHGAMNFGGWGRGEGAITSPGSRTWASVEPELSVNAPNANYDAVAWNILCNYRGSISVIQCRLLVGDRSMTARRRTSTVSSPPLSVDRSCNTRSTPAAVGAAGALPEMEHCRRRRRLFSRRTAVSK